MRNTVEDKQPRLLIVDDDDQIRRELTQSLKARGFTVNAAKDGEAALKLFERQPFDLVVLDIMMPGISGLEVCRSLRAQSGVPILLLTALGEEADRVVGLELGADDYIVKPFSVLELIARIRAALRRATDLRAANKPLHHDKPLGYEFGGWRLDQTRRELTSPDGALVDITSAEFELLSVLVERAGRVQSRDTLLDLTRGRGYDAFDRSIDILISRLRQKLGDSPRSPKMIKTVHAAGYVFVETVVPIEKT